jgi:hypothetical protein
MNIPTSYKALIAKVAVFFILLTPVLTVLNYYLPRSIIGEVGQPYVKRMDDDNNLVGQSDRPSGTTRDVFFIPTFEPGSSDPFVMRNEDTRWGWPPAFKFNSADLNAKASKLNGKVAKLRYYGFRIEFLSIFPNVLSIEEAAVGDSTFPWARTVFGVLALAVFGYLYFVLRTFFEKLSIIFKGFRLVFSGIRKAVGFFRSKKAKTP